MFSEDRFGQIMRQCPVSRLHDYSREFSRAMAEFGIDQTRERVCAFVARLANLTAEGAWLGEDDDPAETSGRFAAGAPMARHPATAASARHVTDGESVQHASDGDTRSGADDGRRDRYRARGPIGLNGKTAYRSFGRLLEVDLEGHPELAGSPEQCFRIAGIFWTNNGLNELADAGNHRAIAQFFDSMAATAGEPDGDDPDRRQRERIGALLSRFGIDLPSAPLPASASRTASLRPRPSGSGRSASPPSASSSPAKRSRRRAALATATRPGARTSVRVNGAGPPDIEIRLSSGRRSGRRSASPRSAGPGSGASADTDTRAGAGAGTAAGADGKRPGARRARARATIAGVERQFNARRDTLDFRDQMFVPTLVEVPPRIPLGHYVDQRVPVLDQGQEGACTGYALATVVHYLLARRSIEPDRQAVSPRMLYEMARRYDEWPGENYDGSSARGAMKGWHKHGVCAEDDWPSQPARKAGGLDEARVTAARRRPLGAYFRVNHLDLVAMHSAIAEVGILYATASVHEGWNRVGRDGNIRREGRLLGGHAFAIVAYDDEGFWLQNSWGKDWGSRGFARLSYDDWLENGTYVWVARLGAPIQLQSAAATAALQGGRAGASAGYVYEDLRPHVISIGNEGLLHPGGTWGTDRHDVERLFEEDLPRITANWTTPRVVFYLHGGLVPEETALQRVSEYRSPLLAQ